MREEIVYFDKADNSSTSFVPSVAVSWPLTAIDLHK